MYIKNKFLRFIVNVFITLTLYFLLAMGISEGEVGKAIEAMFIFAVFGLFIVGPTLIFMVYASYQLLTIKSERSKRAPKILKTTFTFLCCIALLYVAAMYTDLFG